MKTKLIQLSLIVILFLTIDVSLKAQGNYYPTRWGAEYDLVFDKNQYHVFCESGGSGYIFSLTYFSQYYKKAHEFFRKDILFPPYYSQETYKNSYWAFEGGYNCSLWGNRNKLHFSLPSMFYSGIGMKERKTFSAPDGYFEKPNFDNDHYIVLGLRSGLSVEYPVFKNIGVRVSNYVDYEIDGYRKESNELKGTSINLINPTVSLFYYTM